MARNKKPDLIKMIGIAVFIIVGILSFLYSEGYFQDKTIGAVTETDTYIDFISCGQGDSALIVSGDGVMLVDATTADESQSVVDHLKDRGIKEIDLLVLTHPHEDHIGGAASVLDEFEVGQILMKKPTEGTEPTTKVYLQLLKKIKTLGIPVKNAVPGDGFSCGKWDFTVLGPIDEYEELNDQSVVLRGVYDDISVLFKGDQESGAEKELVEEYGNKLHSTIYAVGHHGSSGASCNALLDVVMPQYAVISCGADNSYGHPHQETLDRLEERNARIYRTDLNGTVTLYTDGKNVEYKEKV